MPLTLKIVIYAAIIVAFIAGYAKYIEKRAIFFPEKDMELTPELVNLAFEDIYFKTEDNLRLNGWFIPSTEAKFTILFSHGNAGNIGHRLEKISLLRKANVNIFIFDYRGYGRSQGRPSEAGLYLDIQAAYDYLVTKHQISPKHIILYGESLGNAAIIHLAASQKVAGLIAEGAFSGGKDMARQIYPFLPTILFSNSFDSLVKIRAVKAPKLFLHSRDDEIVPLSLARKLYQAAGEPKQFIELRGSHNDTCLVSQDKYISAISTFLGDSLGE